MSGHDDTVDEIDKAIFIWAQRLKRYYYSFLGGRWRGGGGRNHIGHCSVCI